MGRVKVMVRETPRARARRSALSPPGLEKCRP
jgi:hypothetical protein